MTNNKLYTAVGKFKMKGTINSLTCPIVTVGEQEYGLDMQEMVLWTVLNWRIVSAEEMEILYNKKSEETGFLSHRSVEQCKIRLLQRGLIAEGCGETGLDALYDLLSELYVIPISENIFLRAISFVRLTFFKRIPFSVTKKLFFRDKRSDGEQKIMRLANKATLSTAEIIKCVEHNKLRLSTNEELLDVLYHDAYTTSENIAYYVKSSPACRPVLTDVTNLYLRQRIIFERI